MATILVTGGLGVVGSHLAAYLRNRGHAVWTIDQVHSHLPQHVRADVAQYRQLEPIFAEHCFDYVFHLAAEFGRWNGEDFYETLWMTNAVGTKNVIRLQEKYGFRLIAASSSEVYGDHPGAMAEDVPDYMSLPLMNDYAMTKWVNEMQIRNSAKMHGTESVRFRIFNSYGPGEYYTPYRSVICRFVYLALHGLPYTVHRGHTRTHTYIADAAEWIGRIMDNFEPGEVYNIAGRDLTDIETISNVILRATNRDDRLVTYRDAEPLTTIDKVVDRSRMVRDLGDLNEMPFEEGIERTVAWMRQVYAVA
jgi:dTDP-glucose 4,6-dehydratase